jgi:hypothetical protein
MLLLTMLKVTKRLVDILHTELVLKTIVLDMMLVQVMIMISKMMG